MILLARCAPLGGADRAPAGRRSRPASARRLVGGPAGPARVAAGHRGRLRRRAWPAALATEPAALAGLATVPAGLATVPAGLATAPAALATAPAALAGLAPRGCS